MLQSEGTVCRWTRSAPQSSINTGDGSNWEGERKREEAEDDVMMRQVDHPALGRELKEGENLFVVVGRGNR